MRIKILVFLFLFTSLFPYHARAQSYVSPEFNPMCWKQKECEESRAVILGKTASTLNKNDGGWIENEEPCAQKGWGKCLPAGKTKTSISFGGKNTFVDIGEFLQYNYRFAISIAGILAAIMIVVSGIQWVTSGGNSDVISGSKKRIGGALIGLLIAYLSYTILNIVNPSLVNLRLPQVWMQRPFQVGPEFCKDSEASGFMLAAKKGEVLNSTKIDSLLKNANFNLEEKDKFECGNKYFAQGSGQQTCMGGFCSAAGQTCLPVTYKGEDVAPDMAPGCQEGQLVVHYSISLDLLDYVYEGKPILSKIENEDWLTWVSTKDWFTSGFTFWPVCKAKSGDVLYIGNKQEQWDSGDGRKISKVKNGKFYDYYVIFDKLNPFTNPHTQDDKFWSCYYVGDTVVGFVFNSVLAQNWGRDADFYASKQYIGKWESIGKNGYISVEDLKKGTMVNAVVSSAVLNDILANPTSAPFKLRVGGAENGEYFPSLGQSIEGTAEQEGSGDEEAPWSDADSQGGN